MRLEISKEGVFIPEFKGNKKLASTDQITVRYKTPTIAIKNRCRNKPQAKGIASADGKIEHMEITIEKDNVNTLTEMLVSISNCSYGYTEGKDKAIINANDLLNAPVEFAPLLKEIIAEFDSVLDHSEIEVKN
jgi:hypothetical protein